MTDQNGHPAPALRYERWPLTDLQLDPRNARAHDRPNIDAIKESLERFGQRLPVVVRGGQLIGGNATTIAADELGWTHLDVAVSDDLSVEEARRLAIMLNRSAELATWDNPILLDSLRGFDTLEGTGFSPDDLAELESLLSPEPEPVGGLTDPDAVPEPPAEPVTRPGDLWLLGDRHRLLCGDATKAEDAERLLAGEAPALVLTDPPYGVNERTDRDSKGRGGPFGGVTASGPWASAQDFPAITGDDQPFDPTPLVEHYDRLVLFGANYYAERLPASSAWIVWDKLDGLESEKREVGFNDNADVELAWTNLGGPARLFRHRWTGLMKASEHGRRRVHPTQKPVALKAQILEWRTKPGDLVLDLYAGSGATGIACHRTGRRAALMEIEPSYTDTICHRYQEHTGTKPILEATGEPHDFTALP